MIIEEVGYLKHFGIKGMRWGVRRYLNRKPSTKDTSNFIDAILRKAGKIHTSQISNSKQRNRWQSHGKSWVVNSGYDVRF